MITSDIAIILELSAYYDPDLKKLSMIVNTIRVLRVLRLIRVSEDLRMLIDSLIVILPSISNVISLIFLMLFIFAIIGMNMFSGIKHQKEINDHNNFGSFGMSISLLIRCATGEKWNEIMRELARSKDDIRLHIKYYQTDNEIEEHVGLDVCIENQNYIDFLANGP